jgi:hypothetical protein
MSKTHEPGLDFSDQQAGLLKQCIGNAKANISPWPSFCQKKNDRPPW